ncbi:MAG: hypothetical protein NC184_02455 [Roseburia sp.]|nr:hypothetical protein [Roseburia sp.]
MIAGRLLNKIINIFTGLFGMATLVLMLIVYLNNALGGIIPAATALSIGQARNYCTLATVFCAGIEFTLKRNVVAAVIFACIVVAVAVFMIYTDVSAGI